MPNCTTFLDVNVRLGDKPALIHPSSGTEYSFCELLKRVCRLSSCLIARGIVAGDRVGIYLPLPLNISSGTLQYGGWVV